MGLGQFTDPLTYPKKGNKNIRVPEWSEAARYDEVVQDQSACAFCAAHSRIWFLDKLVGVLEPMMQTPGMWESCGSLCFREGPGMKQKEMDGPWYEASLLGKWVHVPFLRGRSGYALSVDHNNIFYYTI